MTIDDRCKECLTRDRWVGACELADTLEQPWRRVAAALKRLVKKGEAEHTIIDVPGTARSKEQKRVFRRAAPGARTVTFSGRGSPSGR